MTITALQQLRRADGELHHLKAAGHFAQGVVVGLAMLGGDRLGESVGTLPENHLEAVEDARGAAAAWPPRPARRRRQRPRPG